MIRRFVFIALTCATFAACGSREPLPVGTQVRHGVLTAAPLSLDRRGTHLLMSGSLKIAYVESTAVNLRPLEGRLGEFTGAFEPNIQDRDLPVFVVTAAKALGDDAKSWNFPDLGISMRTPIDWVAEINGGVASFTQTGSIAPVLTVKRASYLETPFAPKSATGAATSSSASISFAVVSSLRVAREDDTAHHRVRLTFDLGSSPSLPQEVRALVLDFRFSAAVSGAEQERVLELVQKGFKLTTLIPSGLASSSSGKTPPPATPYSVPSVGGGTVCGGAAGILCPSGFYCSITDKKANIGNCVKR